MKEIYFGVREFQAQIGRALRAVREGRRVVITSRDREVAVLTKPDRDRPEMNALDRKLDRLEAEGWLHRGNGRPIGKVRTFPFKGVVAQLLADRR